MTHKENMTVTELREGDGRREREREEGRGREAHLKFCQESAVLLIHTVTSMAH